MSKRKMLATLFLSVLACGAGKAASADTASPYAGQETRAIKSLSHDDIAELRRGGGWGLAKAAELNGMPGPAHLLELKDQIGLDQGQVTAIEALFAEMQKAAIETGARLIDLEENLEAGFRDRTITEATLEEKLSEIADTHRELRFIHLNTHLKTLPLLGSHQTAMYNSLRGYGSGATEHGGHKMQHGHQ